MDIVLERILSLIPKKPNGDYVHGAKKKFAISIGYDDGQIISMWENGSSNSYRKKLHEISAKYDVSVEWLKGETDIKEKDPTLSDEASEIDIQILNALKELSEEQKAQALDFALFLANNSKK